ncbi:putative ATP-dependent RNA helicase chl1 [Drepanopeziza brunnea f. sp. 'multigermtubi' MB_m1]|uniref:ATP-dependent DNA helicase CHL1 n=1 Tax=Marssonina brunnea f. sp. multigermtubi (strain MB_m1) TaxID=1072389 RepID=K1WM37_MARBU|nr:putative ATP-dependent RNA helicase chl1 [Drepanopeziza brunnea f. sp. 'multigermtubi' MB_m1]EKD18760.1 putative ATP-dependent RNA helicase chl1 [Drepanopeziza brunnea f. sp. 'multigermtubi' MB_m1]
MAQSGDGDEENSVSTRDFHHPFTPYTIQETFMETVYQVLENGKVGILESPTGTGKSLSLICGALTWLRDHKGREFQEGLNWGQNDSDEPEWIIEQARARKRREMLRHREDMEARLAKIRAKEKAQRDKYMKGDQGFKRRKIDMANDDDDEEQYVLDDYESDREHNGGGGSASGLSAETLKLLGQIGMGPTASQDEDEESEDETKIFYCSRTHSQLTQFINELRRVNFPPSIKDENIKPSDIEDLKHLTLGSRKNLCINPKVNKLNSLTAVNERCAELQQTSTPKEHKCVFLPNKENQTLVNTFRDRSLATIRDIEDMGDLGKQIGICPYYASRSAIRPAEIVTLPYPLLLQKSAREALGISLKGHVVIIDEAHNLMDAISGIHGVEVSLRQLKRGRAQLGVYLQKFRNRLKGKNRVYIAQVVRVIDSLTGYLESRLALHVSETPLYLSFRADLEEKSDGIVSDKELLSGKGVDQINLFKLVHYLQESKLARKVESYALYTETDTSTTAKTSEQSKSTPVLHQISSLLLALTHPSKEGRLFYALSPNPASPDLINLKFLLLDPAPHFQAIVSEARAVILAGGTMSPMSDYTSHLFPYLPPAGITTLSCGHVIPKENLLAWNLSRGPTGQEFDFTFKNRGNNDMIDDLGRALLNICTVVPDGVVVFFPSYSYLSSIVSRWEVIPGQDQKSLLQRLEGKKVLFKESKEQSVDTVLNEYAKAIDTGRGGLLLSVVGGKMSEGINFSDSLGRCVVIVGLPFPNINSAEWRAKIQYIESSIVERLEAEGLAGSGCTSTNQHIDGKLKLSKEEMITRGKGEAREFYENACMRAVNQSVGRAIRHRGDYAAIVMIDKRFEGQKIRGKLPGWIREGLVEGSGGKGFGVLMSALGGFFRGKRAT